MRYCFAPSQEHQNEKNEILCFAPSQEHQNEKNEILCCTISWASKWKKWDTVLHHLRNIKNEKKKIGYCFAPSLERKYLLLCRRAWLVDTIEKFPAQRPGHLEDGRAWEHTGDMNYGGLHYPTEYQSSVSVHPLLLFSALLNIYRSIYIQKMIHNEMSMLL